MNSVDQAMIGAAIIGIINVVSYFIPDLDSRIKVGLALILGMGLQYIPFDVAPFLKGLEVAFASSGVYKISQVVGVAPDVKTSKII